MEGGGGLTISKKKVVTNLFNKKNHTSMRLIKALLSIKNIKCVAYKMSLSTYQSDIQIRVLDEKSCFLLPSNSSCCGYSKESSH